MSYLIGRAFWAVMVPSNFLLLLALLGLAAAWQGRRWGLRLATGVALIMLLLTALPIGLWAAAVLEERFPPPAGYPDQIDGIVVLGGGIEFGVTKARGQPTFGDAGERYMELLHLARRYPQAKLVFSGGSGFDPDRIPEADIVRMLADRHGLPPERIIYERHARNTRDNALLTKELVQPVPGERWLLVTSAMHMPRAIGVFRQLGWPMIAWPVDFRSERMLQLNSVRQLARGLLTLDDATYEWLGLAYYRLLGHTDALLPAPGDED